MKYIKVLVATYLLVLLFMVVCQRSIIFHPPGDYLTPEQIRASEWQVINANSGSFAWWSPAKPGKCTVVFAHGNADNINHSTLVANTYIRDGLGFLILEYPGYSKIAGSPSEEAIYAAADSEIKALLDKGVDPKSLIMMGHSLGSAVALEMSLRWQGKGLIMISPFRSIAAMAQHYYPFMASKWFLLDKFANEDKMEKIKVPLFLAHGSKDWIIPQEQGTALFNLAPEPKTSLWTDDGHNDILWSARLTLTLKDWIENVCGDRTTPTKL